MTDDHMPVQPATAAPDATERPAEGTERGEAVEHPERLCWRCGGPNISWSAPSPLWNQVMRGGDINGSEIHNGIVCPTCFAILAQEAGVADLWRFYSERVHVPLQTVTPNGRVWNPDTWLWDGPPPTARERGKAVEDATAAPTLREIGEAIEAAIEPVTRAIRRLGAAEPKRFPRVARHSGSPPMTCSDVELLCADTMTERDRLREKVEAVRALCDEVEREEPSAIFSQGGPMWSIWTAEVRKALDGGEA